MKVTVVRSPSVKFMSALVHMLYICIDKYKHIDCPCIHVCVCPPCVIQYITGASGPPVTVPVLVMWLGSDESADVPDSETQTESVSGCSCRKSFILSTDQQRLSSPAVGQGNVVCKSLRYGVNAGELTGVVWKHPLCFILHVRTVEFIQCFTISTAGGMSNTPWVCSFSLNAS